MATSVSPATAVSVQALQARFVESGAGTYTANFNVPPGATLLDIVVEAEAVWAAGTSAALIVGDSVDDDGFLASINLKATDLLAGESISIGSTQTRGGNAAAYITTGTSTHLTRGFSAAKRTITAKVTSVGVGATGRTRVTVLYSVGAPTAVPVDPA
jgi:hypothetical protein